MGKKRTNCRHFSFRMVLGFLCALSLILGLGLGHLPLTKTQMPGGEVAMAHLPDGKQFLQQGFDKYQAGDVRGAIAIWEVVPSTHSPGATYSSDEITVLKNLVRAYQQVGQLDEAIAKCEELINYYRKIGDIKQMGQMLTEQAQAYISLGQYRRGIAILCGDSRGEEGRVGVLSNTEQLCSASSALEIARSHSDRLGEAAALGSLGNVYLLQGEFERAIPYLEKGLELTRQMGNTTYISEIFNSWGNLYTKIANRYYSRAQLATQSNAASEAQRFSTSAIGYDDQAIQYFQNSLDLARQQNDTPSQVRALLNLSLPFYRRHQVKSLTSAFAPLPQALALWQGLPNSRDKVYHAIKLATLLQQLSQSGTTSPNFFVSSATQCLGTKPIGEAVELLKQAVLIAQHLEDAHAKSFALGTLGHIYECSQNYELALSLTQQAQMAGMTNESLYLWEWQAGRIFKAKDQMAKAIAAYDKALKTLRSIRTSLIIAQRDLQLDFRETIESIYRQYAELRLEQASNSTGMLDVQANLASALATLDELKLAELQNYLGQDCEVVPIAKPVALVDRNTAVFSSIILNERSAIILTLPDHTGKFNSQLHWLPVKRQEFTETINEFRLKLEKRSDRSNAFKEPAKQLYQWVVEPFASDLEQRGIKTLVFVHDGILRSIPMAALYDGQQFLMQKYAIANVPSLTLVNPTQLKQRRLRALAFGLTKPSAVDSTTFFKPLNNVRLEINSLSATISETLALFDENFTPERLQKELEKQTYPIIHLATHGKFGFDGNETYLVTGKLVGGGDNQLPSTGQYNQKLTMNELYQIIRSIDHNSEPIELLALTACETAAGSDRDALGIAGISLQAGAKSAIASLWQVDDEATAQIVARFYQGLRDGLSKAEALQMAQQIWIAEHPRGLQSHPGFWAPFVLIGNWL
ncbi:MAG TPA: hypothetical protein DDZ80_05260 [Cyanobacteria bacterium UBA8803]|nr:hypothetical protein [Cyanobacteria bacterium UBA9273]HBL57953.1 hypothetical protein [Cyanobacteria bacterium UBA8803]